MKEIIFLLDGKPVKEINQLSRRFDKYILEKNFCKVYITFKEHPYLLLYYYRKKRQHETDSIIEDIKNQVGVFEAREMRVTLNQFLKEEKIKTQHLRKSIKLSRKQAEKDRKVDSWLMNLVFEGC